MPLIKLNLIERVKGKLSETPPAVPSVRAAVQSAINEFQAVHSKLPYKEAREAYARLLVGRGFDRTSTVGDQPAHSLIEKGAGEAPRNEPEMME